ncbi:MAG: prepilin-type N-terminal cleavage/methylation domain-containing protein [Planctomycetaceae bacterium]|jgi:type II secretory pathway pseudopilin PulG|nr:prepilin-type N-terminal cleavage/methylation domain-containing protein [Planctomycetaceae bacterium]
MRLKFFYKLRRLRCGFTIVEILIALVLMLLILGIISVSIDIYIRQMTVNRSEMEEAQLARAILERMSQEIRSVVVQTNQDAAVTSSEEFDVELLSSIFGSSYLSDGVPYTPNTNNNAATDADANSDVISTISSSNSSENEQTTESTISIKGVIPGIYGDLNWIQIDAVRLPRGEFFGSRRMRVGSQFQTDRLSSVKTVYYYIGKDTDVITDTTDPRYEPDKLIGSLGRLTDMTAVQYGLFRREFDRQVTQYIVNEGKETDYEQYDEVIAPEVEWIEFSYFDPSVATSSNPAGDWVDYWDMDEKLSLPKAIKITIAIRRQLYGNALINWTNSNEQNTTTNIYSKIIPLPIETKEQNIDIEEK